MEQIKTADGRTLAIPDSSVPATEGIALDMSRFPIVRLVFPIGPLTDAALSDMYARVDALLAHDVRVAAIMDFSALSHIPNAAQRAGYAAWSKRNEVQHARCVVGTASIVTNAIVRGLITAVNWQHRAPTPTTSVPNLDEAIAWCRARLG